MQRLFHQVRSPEVEPFENAVWHGAPADPRGVRRFRGGGDALGKTTTMAFTRCVRVAWLRETRATKLGDGEGLCCCPRNPPLSTEFTKRKRGKKRKERPATALFRSSNNNANSKENGPRNYNDPSTFFRLILGLENAAALRAFPFVILGFHSDNGSEYINWLIAKLLNKLLIEQKYAPLINRFYEEHFNTYLNFHRPCGFATVTVDAKGKRSKKYETYQTPHERLKSIVNAARSKESEPDKYLRKGISLEALDRIAAKQTDNESAQGMQKAKEKLFKKLGTAAA